MSLVSRLTGRTAGVPTGGGESSQALNLDLDEESWLWPRELRRRSFKIVQAAVDIENVLDLAWRTGVLPPRPTAARLRAVANQASDLARQFEKS